MKKIALFLLLCSFFTNYAQECNYSINEKDAEHQLKSTRDYLMYENIFGGASSFVFFSLTLSDGVPILNFQLLAKSKDFPKVYCLDKSSRIYLQLLNGKIVTLINALEEECAELIYDAQEKNNIRILTSSFLFTKGSFEDLESSPVSFMRIKYATETVDYSIRTELLSENDGAVYNPDRYFINYLKCIK